MRQKGSFLHLSERFEMQSNKEVARNITAEFGTCIDPPLRKAIEVALGDAQSELAREVIQHIEVERLRSTADRGDAAYNQAIDDALESVRGLFSRLGISVDTK